jgi:hypothetical protein
MMATVAATVAAEAQAEAATRRAAVTHGYRSQIAPRKVSA